MRSKASAHFLNFLDNLFGESESELPDADCENCKFRQTPYTEYPANQHCYMFEESPGIKCAQFKKVKL